MISQLSKANCKAQIFSAAVAEGGGDDNDNNNNNLIYKAPGCVYRSGLCR